LGCLATLLDKICRFSKNIKNGCYYMEDEFAVFELDSPVLPFMKETAFQRGIDDMVVSGKKEVAG
jgi:hypothetical protein